MFSWFRKKDEFIEIKMPPEEHDDEMEEALWEIKEKYDLATEEVQLTVAEKRRNIKHMHEALKSRK